MFGYQTPFCHQRLSEILSISIFIWHLLRDDIFLISHFLVFRAEEWDQKSNKEQCDISNFRKWETPEFHQPHESNAFHYFRKYTKTAWIHLRYHLKEKSNVNGNFRFEESIYWQIQIVDNLRYILRYRVTELILMIFS